MQEIEEEVIGSHTEDSELHDNEQESSNNDAFVAFGLDKPEVKADLPAKEDTPEPKTFKVKHNKEEVDVPEDQVKELLEKGLNLDKVRGQKTEYEKSLDRVAKLQGYKDHSELIANLDKLEQQQEQKEQNAHNEMLQELRQQAEDVGLDGDKLEAYLMNHPLVKEGERVKQEREEERAQSQQQETKREVEQKWNTMYSDPRVLAVFPSIVEDSKAFERGENASFFTPEMQVRIQKGYDPLDAIMLAHSDKFQTVAKKTTEQRLIKEQQLGLRSKVETTSDSDNEPSIPTAHASAFAAFGLPVESARKYIKK